MSVGGVTSVSSIMELGLWISDEVIWSMFDFEVEDVMYSDECMSLGFVVPLSMGEIDMAGSRGVKTREISCRGSVREIEKA